MTHPLDSLIDQIVGAATKRGEFDDLPGKGKPLPAVENPQDAVLARVMKEADATSPVVIIRKQILAAQDKLKGLTDPDARKAKMQVIADLHTQLAIEMEAFRKYG
ncbi:MAG: DUF1992 domain-containing protein [Pseudomonadota bacterium]